MKKFFTLIALIGICIPAIQGLPAEVEEKYNIVKNRDKLEQLKKCIRDANAITFEREFVSLPVRSLLELERLVNEIKKTTRFELTAMGNSEISLSTVAMGLLKYTAAAAASGYIYMNFDPNPYDKFPKFFMMTATSSLGLFYGSSDIKTGFDYKQYLQDRLNNLDAIAAHIAYVKSRVCPIPMVNAPVAEESIVQAKTVSAKVGVRRNR